jgi:hypothetical protein
MIAAKLETIGIWAPPDRIIGSVPVRVPDGHVIRDLTLNSIWLELLGGKRLLCLSAGVEADERRWLHLSMSYPDHVPDYAELCWAKNWFLGKDRLAIQVFPPRSEHVSDHDFTLHLWASLDPLPLPDFRKFSETLGRKTI